MGPGEPGWGATEAPRGWMPNSPLMMAAWSDAGSLSSCPPAFRIVVLFFYGQGAVVEHHASHRRRGSVLTPNCRTAKVPRPVSFFPHSASSTVLKGIPRLTNHPLHHSRQWSTALAKLENFGTVPGMPHHVAVGLGRHQPSRTCPGSVVDSVFGATISDGDAKANSQTPTPNPEKGSGRRSIPGL